MDIRNSIVVPRSVFFKRLTSEFKSGLSNKTKELVVLDVGCGNRPYEKYFNEELKGIKIKYIGIDYYNKLADLEIDINNEKLPYKDNSIDVVICTEVLEHLYAPDLVIKEMKRVVKKGGSILLTTPFLANVHAKVHDYHRYTHNMYYRRFDDFEIKKQYISNTILSYPLYILEYFLGRIFELLRMKFLSKGLPIIVRFLQYIPDKIMFLIGKKIYFTYFSYVGIAFLG